MADNVFSREVPDTPEQFTHERTILRLDKAGICGLREIVRVNFSNAVGMIPEHIHPDAVEICYYSQGTQVYSVKGENYKMYGGMVFTTYPNEVHSSGNRKQERGGQLFYMIIDTINDLENFLGLPCNETHLLAKALNSLPRMFYAGPDLKPLYEEIFSVYMEKPFCWQVRLKCCVFNLLYELVSRSQQKTQHCISLDMIRMLDYIEDSIYDTSKLTVNNMAHQIHLSVPQFTSRFINEIGMSPTKYINQRRIETACQLLADGQSCTEIAYNLNYASSQHFSSCFRTYKGCSPSAWQKGNMQE